MGPAGTVETSWYWFVGVLMFTEDQMSAVKLDPYWLVLIPPSCEESICMVILAVTVVGTGGEAKIDRAMMAPSDSVISFFISG